MQVFHLGRAPRTKETLPDFLKWRRVTRPPLVFRRLTGSQRTPGFWGVIVAPKLDTTVTSINIAASTRIEIAACPRIKNVAPEVSTTSFDF